MKIKLEEYEKIHDLHISGLKILQNENGFRYGTDAVLLSEFVKIKKGETLLDFCSGSGIIPLILTGKYSLKSAVGLEIDSEVVKTAQKTVLLNDLQDRLSFVCGDIKNASKLFSHSFDVITCNPPYSKSGSGKISNSEKIARARYELDCTMEDVAKSVAKVLKYGGRFYLIHKAERLADIIYTCRKYKLEPKEIKFVHTKEDKNAELVMMCAVLGGGVQVNVLPPLIL